MPRRVRYQLIFRAYGEYVYQKRVKSFGADIMNMFSVSKADEKDVGLRTAGCGGLATQCALWSRTVTSVLEVADAALTKKMLYKAEIPKLTT
jgi:hypothetical protein